MAKNNRRQREVITIFSEKVGCCKWFDNRSVTMLFRNFERMIATSSILSDQKESLLKVQVPYPDVSKTHSQGIVGTDFFVKEQLPIILIICFQQHFFFDLMDVACANSLIVYNMMHPNVLTLLDFKTSIYLHRLGWLLQTQKQSPIRE